MGTGACDVRWVGGWYDYGAYSGLTSAFDGVPVIGGKDGRDACEDVFGLRTPLSGHRNDVMHGEQQGCA